MSSVRAVSALNPWAISPAPHLGLWAATLCLSPEPQVWNPEVLCQNRPCSKKWLEDPFLTCDRLSGLPCHHMPGCPQGALSVDSSPPHLGISSWWAKASEGQLSSGILLVGAGPPLAMVLSYHRLLGCPGFNHRPAAGLWFSLTVLPAYSPVSCHLPESRTLHLWASHSPWYPEGHSTGIDGLVNWSWPIVTSITQNDGLDRSSEWLWQLRQASAAKAGPEEKAECHRLHCLAQILEPYLGATQYALLGQSKD